MRTGFPTGGVCGINHQDNPRPRNRPARKRGAVPKIKRRWAAEEATLHEFSYEAPTTVDQAVKLLAADGDSARVICGGTDLLIQMRNAVRKPKLLVDVKGIPEMREIKFDPKTGLRLGAAVPCIEIHESEVMHKHYPGLTEARPSDRVVADSKPRLNRRQSVQRLAGGRHQSVPAGAGRDREDRRPRRNPGSAGREVLHRPRSQCAPARRNGGPDPDSGSRSA